MGVNSVSEYIEGLNENGKKHVNEFIEFMGHEYPHLNHKICFSMPMWFVGTKMKEGYIGISAAKNHYSIHFSSEDFVVQLSKKLPSCKTGKRCINVKYGDDTSFHIVKENITDFLNTI